jgi:AcrR family transcriptional regulator
MRQTSPSRSRLGLTAEAIVGAATELLREQGLASVTMRRVAQRLEIGTMTLYGYFSDKDALLDAILDPAGVRAELPQPSGAWKRDLRQLMLARHRQLREEPFLLELSLRRAPAGSARANGAGRWAEAVIQILHGVGLSPEQAGRAAEHLLVYTLGHAAFGSDGVSDESYAFGLELLLEGLQARLLSR